MLTSNSSGSVQKHECLSCFHAVSARENISWVWVIESMQVSTWKELTKQQLKLYIQVKNVMYVTIKNNWIYIQQYFINIYNVYYKRFVQIYIL